MSDLDGIKSFPVSIARGNMQRAGVAYVSTWHVRNAQADYTDKKRE